MTSRDLDAQTHPQWMTVCDIDAGIIGDENIKPGLLNLLYGGENFRNSSEVFKIPFTFCLGFAGETVERRFLI